MGFFYCMCCTLYFVNTGLNEYYYHSQLESSIFSQFKLYATRFCQKVTKGYDLSESIETDIIRR